MDDFGLYHYVQGPVRSAAARPSAGTRYRVGSAGLLQHQVRNADFRKRDIVHHNLCVEPNFQSNTIALAKGTKVVESDKYQIVA
jgi:hypothetical protein